MGKTWFMQYQEARMANKARSEACPFCAAVEAVAVDTAAPVMIDGVAYVTYRCSECFETFLMAAARETGR